MDEFQLGLKVSDPNLATPVHSTGRWQFFRRLSLFAPGVLDADAKNWTAFELCVYHSFNSRLFLPPRKFDSLRGSFSRLQSSAITAFVT